MRSGLSTIHHTLTPDAASVLNHSIAEASRRNHSQTTPLHVASTLLSSPSGFLRQACIKSHPNCSHPLQCRALELCFSVALERMPTAQSSAPVAEPPVSNALMAALKRAQAHQRRGCPEQQQQPLLAVKVELEQLIISILDDPSVSRVMREARFSSPAVKATIEQSLNNSSPSPADSTILTAISPVKIGMAIRPAVPPVQSRNLYLNPRLQQQRGSVLVGSKQREDEISKVIDILMRGKKRNPVLVGEMEPESVVKELLRMLEGKELGDGMLRNVEVMKFDKEFGSEQANILVKLKEFTDLVAVRIERLGGTGGVIIDLGDLKWLVEQPPAVDGASAVVPLKHQQLASDRGKLVVAEVEKLLARFKESSSNRVWLIGTATGETYLRCQVYHPSMENDWDLQAVSISERAPGPGLFPRLGASPLTQPFPSMWTSTSAGSAEHPRRLLGNLDPIRRTGSCPECTQKCEQEIAKLVVADAEKFPSKVESEASRSQLPQWLQTAKLTSSSPELGSTKKQKTLEIQRKWKETCFRVHPAFHQPNNEASEKITPMPHLMTGLCGPNALLRQPSQPKSPINRCFKEALQFNSTPPTCPRQLVASRPRSPVQTELVLGPAKVAADTAVKKPQLDQTKDLLGMISSEPQQKLSVTGIEKLLGGSDINSFKKLLKGLVEKVWWQREAASAIATIMTKCKLGTGKQRGSGLKGDTWLLFAGPDRVGKRKMAFALSEQVCRAGPVMISFGSRSNDGGSNMSFRGKTVLDRIAESMRRNPFSVVMLEDFDEADILVRGSIARAMDTGRIADSHGREISLGNVTIILAISWSPDSQKVSPKDIRLCEEKLETLAGSSWQLKLSVSERTAKRRANWQGDDRLMRPRKETGLCLGFDLNEAADLEEDRANGSHDSSDLTVEREVEHALDRRRQSSASFVYKELVSRVDGAIDFASVDFAPFVCETTSSIEKMFTSIVGEHASINIEEEAVQRIMGGIWAGETGVEEWMEGVLIPCFHKLRMQLPSAAGLSANESLFAKLEMVIDSEDDRQEGDRLPSSIKITIQGV